jgi:predicted nucleic acid-binding protein
LNPHELRAYFEWEELLKRGEAAIIGVIRQEVLSGIASQRMFVQTREHLELVPDLEVDTQIHILAAEFFNICKAAGVSPGHIDMTICAAADAHALSIFTTDPDFTQYAKHLPITLHKF